MRNSGEIKDKQVTYNSIFGTKESDILVGTAGNDWIDGWFGNDVIYGGAGNDHLDGRYEDEILYGGPGADTFLIWSDLAVSTTAPSLGRGAGVTTIMDFEIGLDKISIPFHTSDYSISSLNEDSYIYQNNDLMAIVIGTANTLIKNSQDTEIQGYETTFGSSQNDIQISSPKNEIFDGLGEVSGDKVMYSGSFSDYSFSRSTSSLQINDNRIKDLNNYNGSDILRNIEYIGFSDQTIEESKVDVIKSYSGKFSDYKFYKNYKENGSGVIYQIKTDSGYDDITGYPLIRFTGEDTNSKFRDIGAIVDIKMTFDQVTGLNTDSGKMFRLYNAAFKRFPDFDGLKYWIEKYSSGENDDHSVAQSFLISDEFSERYGSNVSNAKYVETLYVNVLGRNYDQSGYNYWLGNLDNGLETRYELLLGFAESAENKTLFTEMTQLFA